jgi:hypothetical protein
MSVITRLYSTFVKPSPPYFAGIFIPKAPRRRSPSRTFAGYSPVRSISAGSTSSRRKSWNLRRNAANSGRSWPGNGKG